MASANGFRYLPVMRYPVTVLALGSALLLHAARSAHAQTTAPKPESTITGGLSLGLSGLRSADGSTLVADVMWVGADMMDGVGVRFVRQGLAPAAHGYAAMLVIGGPPRDSLSWLRLDFGMGYVGRQSSVPLKFLERHGIGAQFGATIAPVMVSIFRPELNGWAIVGTSAQFLGASLGVRILDPRQR
jgi:hypothetical protein